MGGGVGGNFGKTKGSLLDRISRLLAVISLIPGIDSFTDLASIPVDLAREDYISALLDLIGVVPFVGEIADTAKIAKVTDDVVDATKVTSKVVDAGENSTKVTKHGAERLIERGFTKNDIAITKGTKTVKYQTDGAKVYIKEVEKGKYNVIIEGEKGIITALKNISKKSLDRLTKNYNWR